MEGEAQVTLGSLFDGSGTAPRCATLLGWEPLWASEIEPYPVAVTKARFPKMQHLGSITEINGAEIPPVDVIVGGSPCQDLSVAGKQAGLQDGTRSNLFYEMTRIIREMRGATNGQCPRHVVWENVPGAFSSNKGRDFLAVVEAFCALADDDVHIPRPAEDAKTGRLTWKTAGAVVGDGWSFAWRVLDAQYWGVPQRRRRIFAVLDLGSECAGEILFERTRLPWDTEPRGAAREGAPADAVGCADRGGGVRHLQPVTPFTNRGCETDDVTETLRAQSHGAIPMVAYTDGVVGAFCAGAAPAAGSIGYSERVAPMLKASQSSHAVVYALQGNGIDRSVGAGCNGAGWREGEMYTLNTIDRPAVVYDARWNGNGDVAAESGMHQTNCEREPIFWNGEKIAPTLTASNAGGNQRMPDIGNFNCVIQQIDRRRYIVRRLTPTECARLQGFPDWWADGIAVSNPTEQDIAFWAGVWETYRKVMNPEGKPKTRKQIIKWMRDPGSDSNEYKMWGNGMALPCMLAVLRGVGELERLTRRTCPTCAHHLGAEQCRINVEGECREGGGYELWEGKNA